MRKRLLSMATATLALAASPAEASDPCGPRTLSNVHSKPAHVSELPARKTQAHGSAKKRKVARSHRRRIEAFGGGVKTRAPQQRRAVAVRHGSGPMRTFAARQVARECPKPGKPGAPIPTLAVSGITGVGLDQGPMSKAGSGYGSYDDGSPVISYDEGFAIPTFGGDTTGGAGSGDGSGGAISGGPLLPKDTLISDVPNPRLPDKVTGPVPEPATWLMMILGMGLTGGMLRRAKVSPMRVFQTRSASSPAGRKRNCDALFPMRSALNFGRCDSRATS
jgi:hypothetical protein